MISHDLYALVSKLKVAIGSSLIALKYVVLIFEQSCLGMKWVVFQNHACFRS